MLRQPARTAGAGPNSAMMATSTVRPPETRAVWVLNGSRSVTTIRATNASTSSTGCHWLLAELAAVNSSATTVTATLTGIRRASGVRRAWLVLIAGEVRATVPMAVPLSGAG